MSAVIKSRNGVSGPVRSFVATSARQPDAAILPEERFAQERAALLTRIGVLEKQIEDQRAAATRAADEARREGQAAGQAQAEDRQAERLALLAETLAVETAALGERLGRVEGLALSLAHAGLAKMFDAPVNMDAMVRATLARHVATLVDQAILVVGVSKTDFADAGTLEALTVALGDRIVARGHRLNALAVSRTNHARNIGRTHPHPRLVPKRTHKRLSHVSRSSRQTATIASLH